MYYLVFREGLIEDHEGPGIIIMSKIDHSNRLLWNADFCFRFEGNKTVYIKNRYATNYQIPEDEVVFMKLGGNMSDKTLLAMWGN